MVRALFSIDGTGMDCLALNPVRAIQMPLCTALRSPPAETKPGCVAPESSRLVIWGMAAVRPSEIVSGH